MEEKFKISKLLIEKHAGFLLGLIGLGIALIYLGTWKNSTLLIAIGGSLFGGSISSFIAKIDGVEFQEKTLDVITNSLDAKLISEESKVRRYRKIWHVYYGTVVDKQTQWRHILWNFSETKVIGQLTGVHVTYNQENEAVEYLTEGLVRDNRLIVFVKDINSDEPTAITIFPTMGDRYFRLHAGLHIHKTWDGKESIDPIIISSKPLDDYKDEGTIDKAEIVQKLEAIWKKNIDAQSDISRLILIN